jgi:hypothetical protein
VGGYTNFRTGRNYGVGDYTNLRTGHNYLNFGVHEGVTNLRANGLSSGATVIQNTTVNRGLFGFNRSVQQSTTVVNGGGRANVNVQTFSRSRLR